MSNTEWPELHLAVESNNIHRVKQLIQNGVNVNEVTRPYKNTVLHVCANEGNIDIMQQLLMFGTILNKKNRNKETALHIAINRTQTDIIKLLLKHGIDINARNRDGNTALHVAIINSTQIFEYEVEKEKMKLISIIEILVDKGAGIDILNNAGMTSLALVAKNNLLEPARIILRKFKGSIVDHRCIDDKTALYFAASEGYDLMTRKLLEAGAKIDVRINDDILTTPLHALAMTDVIKIEFIRHKFILYSWFKNVIHLLNNEGDTALMLAVRNGLVDSASILVHFGSDIVYSRVDGMTPLKFAAQMKNRKLLHALNIYGDLLDKAIHENNLMIIEALTECGFKFDTEHLSMAIAEKVDNIGREENLKIIRFLTRNVEGTNEFYDKGHSFLGYAILNKKEEVCDDLLEVGCVPSIKDKREASNMQNSHIVNSFLKYGMSFEDKFFEEPKNFESYEEFVDSLVKRVARLRAGAEQREQSKFGTNFRTTGLRDNSSEIENFKKYTTALHMVATDVFTTGVIPELVKAERDDKSLNVLEESPLSSPSNRYKAEMLINTGSDFYHADETRLFRSFRNSDDSKDMNEYLKYSSDLLDVFSKAELRCTPLYKAIILKKYRMAAELIRHGADCNLGRLHPFVSSVMLVQEQNNPYLLNLMIKAGALVQSAPVVLPLLELCILFVRRWLKKKPGGIYNNLKLLQNHMHHIHFTDMVIDMIMLRLKFQNDVNSVK